MWRTIGLRLGLVLLPMLLLWILGEAVLRGYHLYGKLTQPAHTPARPPTPMYLDEHVGWRNTPYYRSEAWHNDAGGTTYFVHYKAGQYGFRMFGDVNSAKLKILIMGDSYTQALQVSNEKTYYGMLQQS
jgi:hypothetical protein